ncbi:MAG: ATP-binding protein, partial [Proteobacteria bacterium]|nr:ATP-binding protein [Pseudomonadota bacterium]
GKTTLALALAQAAPEAAPVQLVDLDVEAPNAHLFLRPDIQGTVVATTYVPRVDEDKCAYCRQCAELCQFKAIAVLGETVITFPQMCHSCRGCQLVCPAGAVGEDRRELGEISWGRAGEVDFLMGRLRVGEAMSPPLMRQVKKRLDDSKLVVIDAPPGTSCPAVEAVRGADVIVLVTEPTPFGVSDLAMAVEAFRPFGIPMGVVVNRAGLGDGRVYDYLEQAGLPLWLEIPFDRRVAEGYSLGRTLPEIDPSWRERLAALWDRVLAAVDRGSGLREATCAR